MKFKDFIRSHRPFLENIIQSSIKNKVATAPLPETAHALQKIGDSVTEGKMLRGMLVLVSTEIHGSRITDEVYATAAALEIFHTGLLIHDDIMDNDHRRRNKDSVYYQYVKEGQNLHIKNSLHYGQSMGLCVGDICFFLGFEILAKNIKNSDTLRKIIQLSSEEMQHVGPAQMADTMHGMTNAEPNEKEIINKYLYKTAHYTFSIPLLLGAYFAENYNETMLKRFGEDAGIIFQLKDDELGIFGDETKIGKQVGSDIRENKKTLLRWYTFNNAIGVDKQRLTAIFGKSTLSSEEIHFVRECTEKYYGVSSTEQEVKKRLDRLQSTILSLEKEGVSTGILQDIVQYNLIRKI